MNTGILERYTVTIAIGYALINEVKSSEWLGFFCEVLKIISQKKKTATLVFSNPYPFYYGLAGNNLVTFLTT